MPAEALRQRPDVIDAELDFASAMAGMGAARADLFPSLSLGGTVAVSNPQSWSFGPALSLPIFDVGARQARLGSANADAIAAGETYRKTVLTAIEGALTRLNAARDNGANARAAVAGYRAHFQSIDDYWRLGGETLLNREEALRSLQSAQITEIEQREAEMRQWIALFKAADGGRTMNERMTKAMLLAAGLLAALIWATAARAQDDQTQAAAALSVTLAPPQRLMWPVVLETNGRLQAWHEAVIASETVGQRIESVNADVGSVVKQGEVLAQLSDETLRNTIVQQEATVLSAEAALDQAKADADRARALTSGRSGAISAQQASEYFVAERKADADLASARAALASSKLDLERTKVVAPDGGMISARSAALGAVVSTGTELFRLIRQNRIEWQAEVPLRFLRDVKVGTKVAIPTPIGTEVAGEVRLISPVASETTGRVTVFVALTPPEGAPMPPTGIMVSGRFDLGQAEALTVPATATSMRDGFTYVFTLEPGSDPARVNRERVETGRRIGDRVEITSGLTGDEQVVQAGGAFLSEGSVVHVVEAAE